MQVKMKRVEIIELNRVLEGLKRIHETRFAYSVAKNKQLIKAEVDSIASAQEPSDKLKEFDKRRTMLVMQYAQRDDKGQLAESGPGSIKLQPDKIVEFNLKVSELEKEFESSIKEFKDKDVEFKNLLKEEIEIELYGIKAEYFPQDIGSDEMSVLMSLIIGDLETVLESRPS